MSQKCLFSLPLFIMYSLLSLILSSACIFINLLCDWFSETVGNNEMAEYRLWNLIDLGLNSPSSLLIPGLRPHILRLLISEEGQLSQPDNGDLRTKWENHTQPLPSGNHSAQAMVISIPIPSSLRDYHAPVECLTRYCTFTTPAALC